MSPCPITHQDTLEVTFMAPPEKIGAKSREPLAPSLRAHLVMILLSLVHLSPSKEATKTKMRPKRPKTFTEVGIISYFVPERVQNANKTNGPNVQLVDL